MRIILIGAIAIAFALLTACQPSPEERFASATTYMDSSEYRAASIELRNLLIEQPDNAQARLMHAHAAFQLADFGTAKSDAERAISLGLVSDDAWLLLGESLLAQGDATGALEQVIPNIPSDTTNPELRTLRGDVFLTLNNPAEAAEEYQAVLDADPDYAGALIGQAVIAQQQGSIGVAEKILQHAEKIHPASTAVAHAYGNFLQFEGRSAEAAVAYRRAIELETPETPVLEQLVSRLNEATVLLDSNDLESASESISRLEQLFPGTPALPFLRGRLAFARGDFEQAEEDLRQYLANAPNDARGIALLGAVSYSLNRLRQAEEYLEVAVRRKVGGDLAVKLLAETRLRLNRPEEALGILSDVSSEGMNDPILLLLLGRAQFGVGDTELAADYFARGADIGTLPDGAALQLAEGLVSTGDHQRAIELLNNLSEGSDPNFRRETLLFLSYLQIGQRETAETVVDSLKKGFSGQARAMATAGVMHQLLGQKTEARRSLEKALSLDPRDFRSLFALGGIAMADNDKTSAALYASEALEVKPSFMPALFLIAPILREEGETDRLMSLIDAAIEDNQSEFSVWLLKARLHLEQDEAAAAALTIDAARDQFPDDHRLDHAEALVRLQEGNTEVALEKIRRAAARDPTNPAYQFQLARISLFEGDNAGALEAIEEYRVLRPTDLSGLNIQVSTLLRLQEYERAGAAVNAFSFPDEAGNRKELLLGDILMAEGRYADAARKYELAAAQAFGQPIALRLARARQLGGLVNATEPLERLLAESPDDLEARSFYARLLETTGQQDAALAEYERLMATGQADPATLNNLAWRYASQGRDGAAEIAAMAYEMAPENPSIIDTYGWILYLDGDVEKARSLIERAAELAPQNSNIQYHLARLLVDAGDTSQAARILESILQPTNDFSSRSEAEELAETL